MYLSYVPAHFHSLSREELWFQTSVNDRVRFVPVHEVSQELGKQMCSELLGFHALTGCDSNSFLAGIRKKERLECTQAQCCPLGCLAACASTARAG